jgi:hypothetical protein
MDLNETISAEKDQILLKLAEMEKLCDNKD